MVEEVIINGRKFFVSKPMWTEAKSRIVGAIAPVLKAPEWWNRREEVIWYVDRCATAGFSDTDELLRQCALRYMAGKRKISAPGTSRRKKTAKEQRRILSSVPEELSSAIASALATKAGEQFLGGNERALNALVGMVLKAYKADPATVRLLISQRLEG